MPRTLCHNPRVPFDAFDCPAIARALAQIADEPNDLADAFFERTEDLELGPESDPMRRRVRREQGFAIRLARGGRTWLASRDAIEPKLFAHALRQVARAMPAAAYPEPALPVASFDREATWQELESFPAAVAREIRKRHVAFPLRLTLRQHRRWVLVVGPRLAAPMEHESYFSIVAEIPWGHWGGLVPALDASAADHVARALVARFRSRLTHVPASGRVTAVLAPAVTAVLLHEAVAHALEADLLALGGQPEAAIGVRLGPSALNVLDDPATSPGRTKRTTDDEGLPVRRRWLLREGVVEQPLADALWAARSTALEPGAGRRGNRHQPPGPRSSHLELMAGDLSDDELLAEAEAGLLISEVSRGQLDPRSGRFTLSVPCARRIRSGVAADAVGPFRLRGNVADLLARVRGIGRQREIAGAGWCAKDGQRLPVWATAPSLRLEGVEVVA